MADREASRCPACEGLVSADLGRCVPCAARIAGDARAAARETVMALRRRRLTLARPVRGERTVELQGAYERFKAAREDWDRLMAERPVAAVSAPAPAAPLTGRGHAELLTLLDQYGGAKTREEQ